MAPAFMTERSPSSVKMPLQARAYQREMLAQALKANIIVRMDTGTGKSLIAMMLIRAMHLQYPSKLIAFIVPTVPLVSQQAAAIRLQTDLKVQHFTGDGSGHAEGKIDLWNKQIWQQKLGQANVICLTSMILLNLFHHAYSDIFQFSLLVYDEAHHCARNHAYARIQRDFYHPQLAARRTVPKILGLTASPVFDSDPGKTQKTIADLEATLHAKLHEAQIERANLQQHSRHPLESIESYSAQDDVGCGTSGLIQILLDSSAASAFKDDKLFQDADLIVEELGSLALDFLMHDWLTQLSRPTLNQSFAVFLSTQNVTALNTTTKVRTLIDILSRYDMSEAMTMVFVQRRTYCTALKGILNRSSLAAVRAEALVGHGGSDTTGQATNRQADVIGKFRKRQYNLLVCTQVAEEGLDFPACRLVIRFDPPQQITSYIQSRGRARALHSDFIALVEADSNVARMLEKFRRAEVEQKEFYGKEHEDENEDEAETDSGLELKTSSGAIANYLSSVSLLYYTCALLPSDEYTPNQSPIFSPQDHEASGTFAYTITLPSMPFLKPQMHTLKGPAENSKKRAKQAAAFQAVCRIYRAGGLNQDLIPLRVGDGAASIDAFGRLLPTSFVSTLTIESPLDFGKLQGQLYLHKITIAGIDGTIGLICGRQLDLSVDSYIGRMSVSCLQKLTWSASEDRTKTLQQLKVFNPILIQALFNRKWQNQQHNELTFLLCPLSEDDAIDWTSLARRLLPLHDNLESDQVLISAVPLSRPRSSRIFSFARYLAIKSDDKISADLNMIYPAPAYDTYRTFFARPYLNIGELADDEKYILVKPISDEALDGSGKSQSTESPVVLPLSILRVLNAPKIFISLYKRMPVFMRYLRDHIRSLDASEHLRKSLGLKPAVFSFGLLQKALTYKNLGVPYDHEALEFLGDSVLKFVASVYIYKRHAAKGEGFMSKLRSNSTDNVYLARQAVKAGLQDFIVTDELKIQYWTPTLFKTDLHTRRLADVMEAIIGAAFLTGGLPNAIHVCMAFDIPAEGGDLPPGRLSTTQMSTALEQRLGYRFKNAEHLRAALTHRSLYGSITVDYQRLEFLGDAFVDYYISATIFELYPEVNPEQATILKSHTASNTTLAYLAMAHLHLHQNILHGSFALQQAISEAIEQLDAFSSVPLAVATWQFDFPKVLADCFEACFGAILVDSDWNIELAKSLLDPVLRPILRLLGVNCHEIRCHALRKRSIIAKNSDRSSRIGNNRKISTGPSSGMAKRLLWLEQNPRLLACKLPH